MCLSPQNIFTLCVVRMQFFLEHTPSAVHLCICNIRSERTFSLLFTLNASLRDTDMVMNRLDQEARPETGPGQVAMNFPSMSRLFLIHHLPPRKNQIKNSFACIFFARVSIRIFYTYIFQLARIKSPDARRFACVAVLNHKTLKTISSIKSKRV